MASHQLIIRASYRAIHYFIGLYFFLNLLPFHLFGYANLLSYGALAGAAFMLGVVFLWLAPTRQPLKVMPASIYLFLASLAISLLISSDFGRSLRSASVWIPGFVILAVASQTGEGVKILKYFATAVFASLFVTVAWIVILSTGLGPSMEAGEPIVAARYVVVPNDLLIYVIAAPIVLFFVKADRLLGPYSVFVTFLYLTNLCFLCYFVDSHALRLMSCLLLLYTLLGFQRGIRLLHAWGFWFALFFLTLIVGAEFGREISNFLRSDARLWIWLVSFDLYQNMDSQFFGVGYGFFDVSFAQARNAWDGFEGLMIDERYMGWAHNLFIEALIDRGFLGLLIFLGVLFDIYKQLYCRISESLTPSIFVSVSLFILAGFIELTFLREWVCLLFCLFILTVTAKASDSNESEAKPAS